MTPDFNQHPLQRIFNINQPLVPTPVVFSAFTGCGKTYELVKHLALYCESRQWLGGQYVVAFKEVQLACEAAVDFLEHCRFQGIQNPKNHYAWHFNVTEEHISSYEDKVKADPTNEKLKKILWFMRNTQANTKLNNEKTKKLLKSNVIFTTHESILSLGRAGLAKGRHSVWDESPAANYIHVFQHSDIEALKSYIESGVDFKREATLKGAVRIGSFLECGIMKWHEATRDVVNEKGITELQERPVYVDFGAFESASITLMSAFADGTTIKQLEVLSGQDFYWVDSPTSMARREDAASRIIVAYTSVLSSVSKAASKSQKAESAMMEMMKFAKKVADRAFFIGHKRSHKDWSEWIPTVKNNQTGLNTLKDRDCAFVGGLGFMTPEEHARWKFFLGEKFEAYEEARLSAELMQSGMRGSLRDHNNKDPFLFVCGDERVAKLIGKACGCEFDTVELSEVKV
jgi:hypothetical protein